MGDMDDSQSLEILVWTQRITGSQAPNNVQPANKQTASRDEDIAVIGVAPFWEFLHCLLSGRFNE